jgi:hypothetical protein
MSDSLILYSWPVQPSDAPTSETTIVVTLRKAQTLVAKAYLPHEVRIRRIRELWKDRLFGDADALREELRCWCKEQWGHEAVGGVLNADEARYSAALSPGGFDGSIARVPFDTAAAWTQYGGSIWRFKDERHAALFKLRAY